MYLFAHQLASNTISENLTGELEDHNDEVNNTKSNNVINWSAATMSKPSRRTQKPPDQLPILPSSMSLHSFKALPTTNTLTRSNRSTTNRTAITPNSYSSNANKYLDLSSPQTSSNHHDFADYNGNSMSLMCLSFVFVVVFFVYFNSLLFFSILANSLDFFLSRWVIQV